MCMLTIFYCFLLLQLITICLNAFRSKTDTMNTMNTINTINTMNTKVSRSERGSGGHSPAPMSTSFSPTPTEMASVQTTTNRDISKIVGARGLRRRSRRRSHGTTLGRTSRLAAFRIESTILANNTNDNTSNTNSGNDSGENRGENRGDVGTKHNVVSINFRLESIHVNVHVPFYEVMANHIINGGLYTHLLLQKQQATKQQDQQELRQFNSHLNTTSKNTTEQGNNTVPSDTLSSSSSYRYTYGITISNPHIVLPRSDPFRKESIQIDLGRITMRNDFITKAQGSMSTERKINVSDAKEEWERIRMECKDMHIEIRRGGTVISKIMDDVTLRLTIEEEVAKESSQVEHTTQNAMNITMVPPLSPLVIPPLVPPVLPPLRVNVSGVLSAIHFGLDQEVLSLLVAIYYDNLSCLDTLLQLDIPSSATLLGSSRNSTPSRSTRTTPHATPSPRRMSRHNSRHNTPNHRPLVAPTDVDVSI